MKYFNLLGFLLAFFTNSYCVIAKEEIHYFYDSSIHYGNKNFSAFKYDVYKPFMIKDQLNQMLVFDSTRFYTQEELQVKAKRVLKSEKAKLYLQELSDSYKYLNVAMAFDVKKLPAIVLVENQTNWIVYGEQNIFKALTVIRNSPQYLQSISR